MSRFARLSGRRKALLGVVLAMLALVAAMSWLGVAGFHGTQPGDMDWNADGTVSRTEIAQGYYAVVVDESSDGRRTCRSHAWLRDRANPIRVDCRVEFAAPGDDAPATQD